MPRRSTAIDALEPVADASVDVPVEPIPDAAAGSNFRRWVNCRWPDAAEPAAPPAPRSDGWQ